jgi:hypothetical protein
MKTRLLQFDPWNLNKVLQEADPETFVVFLTPLRLLKNIGKEYFYELVNKYESDHANDFPYDLLLKNTDIKATYWMDQNLPLEELKLLTEEKTKFWENNVSIKDIEDDNSKVFATEADNKLDLLSKLV